MKSSDFEALKGLHFLLLVTEKYTGKEVTKICFTVNVTISYLLLPAEVLPPHLCVLPIGQAAES